MGHASIFKALQISIDKTRNKIYFLMLFGYLVKIAHLQKSSSNPEFWFQQLYHNNNMRQLCKGAVWKIGLIFTELSAVFQAVQLFMGRYFFLCNIFQGGKFLKIPGSFPLWFSVTVKSKISKENQFIQETVAKEKYPLKNALNQILKIKSAFSHADRYLHLAFAWFVAGILFWNFKSDQPITSGSL